MVHSYQIIFSIVSIFAIVRLLYSIRTVWFGTEIIERKAVHTIAYGLVIGLFLLVLKISFCYDTHLVNPWNYAFGSIQSNLIAFGLSVIVCLNAYLSFVIVSQFFFSMLVAINLLALEIWIFRLIYHLINEYFKEKNIYLRGYKAKLLREEISRLKGLGYNILPEVIGFGNYGTVYKCLRRIRVDGNENNEQMVAKVIDVSQLVKYIFGRLRHQEMANLQNSMNIGINALNALIHRNICQIERTDITRDENALISKVVLFSKMAQMNLDFYLEHIKPKGVGEECARFWFRQLCDAVNYLHNEYDRNRCLTPSNIKPENVLLFKRVQRNETEPEFDVKLSDCGIASLLLKSGKVTTKKSPIYFITAPENTWGRNNLKVLKSNDLVNTSTSMADDIYSLGVVLVLLIKGDLQNLVDKPKDTQRILEYHSRVDGIYVEFSAQVVKQLSGEISPQLYHLFKRTLNRIRNYRIDINGVRSHPWLRQKEIQ